MGHETVDNSLMSELDVAALISVRQAINIIDAAPVSPRMTTLALDEALNHRLAEDLAADRDYPPFDKSQMDGYAIRCVDVARTPVVLQNLGEIAAGQVSHHPLTPGKAIAIMTGAALPPGADGVVPVEDTEPAGDHVRILRADNPGRYIARKGDDIAAGSTLLSRGTLLTAAQVAAAAMVGASRLCVFARPRVGVLSTGDELVTASQTPIGAQIRNSNSPMLMALLRQLGCEPIDLGIVRDDPAAIRSKLEEGLTCDVLMVSGGMSMGTHDHVPRLLGEIGCTLRITKLRIKPGKPFVFGDRAGRFVFGLPGNPVSGFVCVIRLASRLLERLAGGTPREKWVTGQLETPLASNGPREFYQPCQIRRNSSATTITPMGWKGSADLFTLASANGLLVRPENDSSRGAGDTVSALEIW